MEVTLKDGEKAKVIEMFLCEQNFLILRPNQLYYFTVDPNCDACNKIANNYNRFREKL